MPFWPEPTPLPPDVLAMMEAVFLGPPTPPPEPHSTEPVALVPTRPQQVEVRFVNGQRSRARPWFGTRGARALEEVIDLGLEREQLRTRLARVETAYQAARDRWQAHRALREEAL